MNKVAEAKREAVGRQKQARLWVAVVALMVALMNGMVWVESGVGPLTPSGAAEEAMFELLTETEWLWPPPGEPNPFGFLEPTLVQLRRDGAFVTTTSTDTGEHRLEGRWHFRLEGESVGVLLFTTNQGWPVTSELPFQLKSPKGGGLVLDHRDYVRGNRIAYSPAELERRRSDLAPAVFPSLECQLTMHPWSKTDNFDLELKPDQLVFHADRRLTASYRQGRCVQAGNWALQGSRLQVHFDLNECDGGTELRLAEGVPRAGLPPAKLVMLQSRGKLLLLNGASYAKPEEVGGRTRSLLDFSPEEEGLFLSVELARPLVRGKATPIQLSLLNLTGSPRAVAAIEIESVKRSTGSDRQPMEGPARLAKATFESAVLEPGQEREVSLVITPTEQLDRLTLRFVIELRPPGALDPWRGWLQARQVIVPYDAAQ